MCKCPLIIVVPKCSELFGLFYLPMQFQTAIEYQRFAVRWFKCCVRVALDLVSALNSWWNSGSSFGLSFFNFERCYSVLF